LVCFIGFTDFKLDFITIQLMVKASLFELYFFIDKTN